MKFRATNFISSRNFAVTIFAPSYRLQFSFSRIVATMICSYSVLAAHSNAIFNRIYGFFSLPFSFYSVDPVRLVVHFYSHRSMEFDVRVRRNVSVSSKDMILLALFIAYTCAHIKMTMSHRHCFAQEFRSLCSGIYTNINRVNRNNGDSREFHGTCEKNERSTDSSDMKHKKQKITE